MAVKALATTVASFLAKLPAERRREVERVRNVVQRHLPSGYEEVISKNTLVNQVLSPPVASMLFDLQPTLKGELLELRPLTAEDFDDLFAVAADPLIWEQHPAKDRYEEEQFRGFFREAFDSGGALIAIDTKTGRVIGSSRFHGYSAEKSEVEIGWTFLSRSHWGGRYNREMKQLMVQHAFRFVDRVLFLIGPHNRRSQRAVEKIGAVRVGSRLDGNGRESVVYRISAATFGQGQEAQLRAAAQAHHWAANVYIGMSPHDSVHAVTAPPAHENAPTGLTTTKAAFIEEARSRGELYITQPYELYSEANHETWRKLYARMHDRWLKYANGRFLQGLETLCLPPDRIPLLEDVNKFLAPRTGFRAIPVSGFVPAFLFFDCLSRREFPTTITIRDGSSLDYLPEPDIFHDIAGHVPMHTDPAFADALARFGEAAHTAVKIVGGIKDPDEQVRRTTSIMNALARFFWFTVEFGLMREGKELKAYGSGLLSSYGELARSVDSPEVQRFPVQLEWLINQYFEIDHYQPLLFIVDSFDHLFSLVGELEKWMKDGKLDNVAPAKPTMGEADVRSFIEAGLAA